VWDGGNFDPEERWRQLKAIGYDGVERLPAVTEGGALSLAATLHSMGLDFATFGGPTPDLAIRWTAAFGKQYVWTSVTGKDFDTFCRPVNVQAAACRRWGIRVAIHNHLGSLVESQHELEMFLANCPDCGLILDTAHLAGAEGDAVDIAARYTDRLVALHLKDWLLQDINAANWWDRGRFCELGAGNVGLDNAAVLRTAVHHGYDGWVFIEQDTHLQNPYLDLAISRKYLADAGF
jgi:sugar phosphate isomerase/epimerase